MSKEEPVLEVPEENKEENKGCLTHNPFKEWVEREERLADDPTKTKLKENYSKTSQRKRKQQKNNVGFMSDKQSG